MRDKSSLSKADGLVKRSNEQLFAMLFTESGGASNAMQ